MTTTTTYITNTDLKSYAARKINLSADEASSGRKRVRFLRRTPQGSHQ